MLTLADYAEYLQSWEGTPYSDGKSGGINCIRWACATLDWLHGYTSEALPTVPNLPRQTAIHNPEKAMEVVRFICRRYPHDVVYKYRPETDHEEIDLLPADVVVTQAAEDHPSHILVAGPEKNVLWHSYNYENQDKRGGVTTTGLGWCVRTGIYRIWRPTEVLLHVPAA